MLGPFALFCGVVILAGWFFLIRDWLASANWSSVRGTVRGVDVAAMQSTDPLRPWKQVEGFRAIIRYAYEVDEQTYVGERFSATRDPFFATEADANAFLQRFPLRSQVSVRIDPRNPKQSLLQRRLSPADALPGYLGLGCLMVGLLLL
ncbi:MAG: DUF3592 domain-containing protein [Rhizobiales bacterium]|nr:DUF3592 domain-containing protein [Hyphomicrobiales bacterium]MBO6700404.1 DUF3592 domain-containing protein [Hyphomicrobiales bacterium]MBO6737940.1 DUF3592 domain-containing protein [Hyphomicrobiales bacterium]MBO6913753.1 DUF3592 domain-containing protein [Hyphomicrobiales bacterium]MBO6954352.1 DUF3592 domain-containing protein [Hyphomicrobiales bacterium]